MIKLKKKQLFSKLSNVAYRALESATTLCKTRGNPYVDIAHYINQILLSEPNDLHEIIKYFNIDEARLSNDLTKTLDLLPRGASSISGFSPLVETAIQEALSRLIKNKTVLIIAHRMRTIANADKIVVLKDLFKKLPNS